MALDRQRILSELGSVMNQLQSADCGCMNKLFSGSGQEQPCGQRMGAPLPTCGGCRRGCCQGHGYGGGSGYGAPCAAGGFGAPCAGGGGCFGAPCTGGGGGSFGAPCAGDAGGAHRPCMGAAYNAPKLYADTYSYLNQNLMQPVVKEVYDDLRSMTPANTVAMNPLANQIGLQGQGNSGNNAMQGNQMSGGGMGGMPPGNAMGDSQGQMGGISPNSTPVGNAMGNLQGQMGGMSPNGMPAGNAMGNPQGQMGGMSPSGMGNMGAQIVNMMMSGGGGRPKNMPQAKGGQLKESMLIDAPHSPHGAVGVTPLNQPMGGNAAQYGMGNVGMSGEGQGNPYANPGQTSGNMGAQMMNPVTQYVTQDNMYNAQTNPSATESMAQNMNPGQQSNMNMNSGLPINHPSSQQPASGFMNPNSAVQQMANTQSNPYGQHGAGVKKFNEMFPGLIQGGDLGFDPMAIALQMNPANQKMAAMNTINKLMSGKSLAGNTNSMQPTTNGSVNQTNVGQYNQPQQNFMQNPIPQNAVPTNQMANQQVVQSQQNVTPTGQMGNQQMMQGQQQPTDRNIGAVPQSNQQVYTAVTGATMMNQQQMQGQQAQQMSDPNTGAAVNPSAGYGDMAGDPNAQMQESTPVTEEAPPPEQQMYKEPIWPAEPTRTSRYMTPTSQLKQIHYNTLGQPIQMLPGNIYHKPEPSLPQTLSPQTKLSRMRNDIGRFNVKSTMSKTSLMGNKPVGRTPSRNQLQHIYQQYKGSQSYTQQNLGNPRHGVTHSDGRLNPPAYAKPQQQIPLERVGGDNSANNSAQNQMVNKVDQIMGQIGDVPTGNKPHGDGGIEKAAPVTGKRCRNGLQDMVYTSAPTNAAWSFHGDGYAPPRYYRGNGR